MFPAGQRTARHRSQDRRVDCSRAEQPNAPASGRGRPDSNVGTLVEDARSGCQSDTRGRHGAADQRTNGIGEPSSDADSASGDPASASGDADSASGDPAGASGDADSASGDPAGASGDADGASGEPQDAVRTALSPMTGARSGASIRS
jgi:hypothetical protein